MGSADGVGLASVQIMVAPDATVRASRNRHFWTPSPSRVGWNPAGGEPVGAPGSRGIGLPRAGRDAVRCSVGCAPPVVRAGRL